MEDCRAGLTSVDMEFRTGAQQWLMRDCILYWQAELKKRNQEVGNARTELFRRKLASVSNEPPDLGEKKELLRRAERRLEEAEQKMKAVKRWEHQLQHAMGVYLGKARPLGDKLDSALPHALTLLDNMTAALDAYISLSAPSSASVGFAPAPRETGGALAVRRPPGGRSRDQRRGRQADARAQEPAPPLGGDQGPLGRRRPPELRGAPPLPDGRARRGGHPGHARPLRGPGADAPGVLVIRPTAPSRVSPRVPRLRPRKRVRVRVGRTHRRHAYEDVSVAPKIASTCRVPRLRPRKGLRVPAGQPDRSPGADEHRPPSAFRKTTADGIGL